MDGTACVATAKQSTRNNQMTKKDYELIAFPIKRQIDYANRKYNGDRWLTVSVIAKDLADLFAQANPRFDRNKFLQACGIETGTKVDFTKDPEWSKAQFETDNQ